MTKVNSSTKNNFILFAALLFVYIILFEFILSINKVLPKPTLLYESIIHIWRDYNFFFALTTTTSVIYIALLLGFVIIYLSSSWLLKIFVEMEGAILSLRLFRYLPAFFFAILFNFWFSDNLFAEFVFALLATIFLASQKLFDESKQVKEEYILTAKNLNLTASDIYKDVYWKSSLPDLIKYFERIHYYLWVLVLIYEFIGNSLGLGFIYRTILLYEDFTALFTTAVIVSLLIWFGSFVIRFTQKKFIFWNS